MKDGTAQNGFINFTIRLSVLYFDFFKSKPPAESLIGSEGAMSPKPHVSPFLSQPWTQRTESIAHPLLRSIHTTQIICTRNHDNDGPCYNSAGMRHRQRTSFWILDVNGISRHFFLFAQLLPCILYVDAVITNIWSLLTLNAPRSSSSRPLAGGAVPRPDGGRRGGLREHGQGLRRPGRPVQRGRLEARRLGRQDPSGARARRKHAQRGQLHGALDCGPGALHSHHLRRHPHLLGIRCALARHSLILSSKTDSCYELKLRTYIQSSQRDASIVCI